MSIDDYIDMEDYEEPLWSDDDFDAQLLGETLLAYRCRVEVCGRTIIDWFPKSTCHWSHGKLFVPCWLQMLKGFPSNQEEP